MTTGRGYDINDEIEAQDQDADLASLRRPIPVTSTATTSPARVVGTPWDPPVDTFRRKIDGVEVSIGAEPRGTASEVFIRVYARSYLGLPPAEMREIAHALLRAADEGESRWPEGYFK